MPESFSPSEEGRAFHDPEEDRVEVSVQQTTEKPLPTVEEARAAGYKIYGSVESRIQDVQGNWHELPEPGFIGNQFWVNEDNGEAPKGKGYGQALLLATAKEHGAYYSLDSKRLETTQRVIDALERKGLVTVTSIVIGGESMKMIKPI